MPGSGSWAVGSLQLFSKEAPCLLGPGRELGTRYCGKRHGMAVWPPMCPYHQDWHGPRKQPDTHGLEPWKQISPIVDLDTLGGTPGPRKLEKALSRGGGGGEIQEGAA